ncbi:MAG: glycosyltransferase involved in cell wall biosynthesis [Bacteroidia bacterium]|jgi:glycosyltransferase involved in cell wall biosynthesis
MRIGISINSAWNIYNFRKGLVKGLQAEGHEVIAIAPYDDYVEKLKEMGCEYFPLKMQNKGKNPFSDLMLIYRLGKIYREAKLDVVLQFTIKPNIYGSLAAGFSSLLMRTAKLPVINNVTGLGTVFIREKSFSSKVAKVLYRFSFRYPNLTFFQNPDDQQVFLNKHLVPKTKVDILPGSGINLQEFAPVPKPESKQFTFLVISRLLIDKGLREFTEAIRLLRAKGITAKFQLVGPMDLNSGLGITEAEVELWQKDGLIEYFGRQDDVKPFIQNSDCVVLPSYREGTPRTLIEAASMAKPIVTTDVPGCRETVEDGFNGFLCEVQNAEDLAEKMGDMIELKASELEEMGNNSRKLAESKFDEQIVVGKYLKHIRKFDKYASKKFPVPYLFSYLWSKVSPQRNRE